MTCKYRKIRTEETEEQKPQTFLRSAVKRLVSWVYVILNPKYWAMNYPYSAEWDKELNDLLDRNKFVVVDAYYVSIGGKTVWARNYPYASFACEHKPTSPIDTTAAKLRPSRVTILRAWKKLVNDCDS